MNEYVVTISLECSYVVIAPTEPSAVEMALEWFDEAEPDIKVEKK